VRISPPLTSTGFASIRMNAMTAGTEPLCPLKYRLLRLPPYEHKARSPSATQCRRRGSRPGGLARLAKCVSLHHLVNPKSARKCQRRTLAVHVGFDLRAVVANGFAASLRAGHRWSIFFVRSISRSKRLRYAGNPTSEVSLFCRCSETPLGQALLRAVLWGAARPYRRHTGNTRLFAVPRRSRGPTCRRKVRSSARCEDRPPRSR
jgi:hypothetical protein